MQGIRPISTTEIVEHNVRRPTDLTAFARVVSVPLVFRPGNGFTHRGGRDTRDPRREEGGYSLQYLTDEQRRMSRCIAPRMRSYFRDGTLGMRRNLS